MSQTLQEKSDRKLYARIEKLKAVRQWTWKKTAAALDLSVAMLMMIKSGERGMSSNSFFRLCEAERAAGIEVPNDFRKALVEQGLSSPRTDEKQKLYDNTILKQIGVIEAACAKLRKMLSGEIVVETEPLNPP